MPALHAEDPETDGAAFARVLILDSFHDEYSWTERMVDASVEALRNDSRHNVEVIIDHLDLRRNESPEYREALINVLREKYAAGTAFDVVIAFETPAMRIALQHREAWFPDTPVVVAGTSAVTEAALQGHRSRVTGVRAGLNHRGTIELALALHPDSDHLYVLADRSRSGRETLSALRALEPHFSPNLEFHYLTDIAVDDLPARLRQLPDNSILFTNGYASGPEGQDIGYAEVWHLIEKNADVPIYSVFDQNVAEFGAAGGVVTTGTVQGEYAAGYALRLLDGESPADIPIEQQAFTEYLDFEKLSALGLGLRDLPTSAVVFNAPPSVPTLYETHTTDFWAVAVSFTVLSVLVLILGRALRQRRTAEKHLAGRNRAFHILSDVNQALIRAPSEHGMARSVCETVTTIGGHAEACVVHGDPTHSSGLTEVARCISTSDGESCDDRHGHSISCKNGPLGAALSTGAAAVISNTLLDTIYPEWSDRAVARGIRSAVAIPLRVDDSVIGAFCVCSRHTRAFENGELRLLGELAEDLSYGIGAQRAADARRRADRALRENREFLRSILETSPAGVMLIDNDGLVAYANSRAQALLGGRAAGLISRPYPPPGWKLTGAGREPGAPYLTAASAARSREQAVFEVEEHLLHEDGTVLALSANAAPVYFQDGSLRGIVVVLEDIGHRLEIERELAEARDAAEESSRTKSSFMANMSHELRTPLNGIIGMTELLGETELDDSQLDFLEMLRYSADTLFRMVQDVLDFSHIDAGRLVLYEETFDLRELVDTLCRAAMVQVDRDRVDFSWHVDTGCTYCTADRTRFAQVLHNLVTNAAKFTADGAITLSVEAGEQLYVRVEDTGRGIDEAQLERAFDSFTQLEDPYTKSQRGLGVGLPIVRGLVDLMNGTMEVHSAPGRGTRVELRLPLEHAPHPPGDTPATPERSPGETEEPLRVLLVEDEAINRMYLTALLREQGCEVDTASSGKEALRLAARAAYDVIFMDIGLPDIDGAEVARRIRAGGEQMSASSTPIAAVTAYGGPDDRRRYAEAGIGNVITKPFSADDIGNVLARVERFARSI